MTFCQFFIQKAVNLWVSPMTIYHNNILMPYSDFTLLRLEEEFGLRYATTHLFPKPHREVPPSSFLQKEMERAEMYPLSSEKAKSELMITPILKEVLERNNYIFSLFSGYSLDVQGSLSGICDYILSAKYDRFHVRAPIVCLVEAKNRTIEEGYGQCAAEMYAAQLFNQQKKQNITTVFGCVSTGYEWNFLKLEQSSLLIDIDRFTYYQNLPQLLGAWQYIIDFYKNI